MMQGKSRKFLYKSSLNPVLTLNKPCINLVFDQISDSGNLGLRVRKLANEKDELS
ncbi:hypothetical protein FHS59_001968 [Algoriphagus iocasae]|uniref:Uncharacterized protein n=1 Tax=Algoriphagus iocasae TaxID=1836499 RepID=A0A841MG74_9BACT|nr:hypothetical protein [Algoriphagus iocasae]